MLYCVFGNPIAHSRSPQIHGSFARLTGQTLTYEARLAPLDGFAQAANAFFAEGGLGCNVTVPFKVEALAMADAAHERAQACGAANTLWLQDGKIHADNTDGAGLVRDLTVNLGVTLAGARVLLLGAGGAARGAILPLIQADVASVTIANRTEEKASALAKFFRARLNGNKRVRSRSVSELANRKYDLVINATAASLSDQAVALPDHVIREGGVGYDMVYGKTTLFLAWAAAHGAQAHDGLGMLVEQAAESFAIWRGFRPSTRETLALLRSSLSAEATGLVPRGVPTSVSARADMQADDSMGDR